MDKIYIKRNSKFAEVNDFYQKSGATWVTITQSEFLSYLQGIAPVFGGVIPSVAKLDIAAPASLTAKTCQCVALLDNQVVRTGITWSVVSGSTYATIDQSGFITFDTAASETSVIIQAEYADKTATHEMTVTYDAGSESETTAEVTVDDSGNTTTVITIITENQDGSSQMEVTSTIADESGNTIGSSEFTSNNNADGSFESTSVIYDGEGNPTEGENVSGDTSGNINTQEVTYDESGNSAVTSYTIDTTGNPSGTKNYNGDGVNTEYYAFDVTQGFVLDFHFTIDFSKQPAGQDENHHNILTAKRANPSPWYGFQLRQTSTAKTVTLGTQFSTGSNTNTTVAPMSSTGNVAEYNFKIIYDPTASTNKFRALNAFTSGSVYTSNNIFPDIEALKYLKVTIGYAMDPNGDPFRYSNINVKNCSLRKLTHVVPPVITCDGEHVSITCETAGATIYYRLNQAGLYTAYTSSFTISADTIVQAYAELNDEKSTTVTETCIYDSGVEDPVIYCDGEQVSITCETTGATIYYRQNETGNFTVYESAFTITADTVVEAFGELNGKSGRTISETCIYNPGSDYSKDYLTFRVISGGTIAWTAAGTGYNRAIQYSVNNGNWTSLTATSEGSTFTVSAGDVVRFRGTNSTYAGSNANYDGFSGGTAIYNAEGNIMSLIYGDNFVNNTALTGTYNFCSMFKQTNIVSAENLVLPSTVLTPHCYRALFANSPSLEVAPELPALTLADSCYKYMFQEASITTAPDLLAPTLVVSCYEGMFNRCPNLNHIKCLATVLTPASATTAWTQNVANTGIFIKKADIDWERGNNGIPTKWTVSEIGTKKPSISCDGLYITITPQTQGADTYYRLNQTGTYAQYSSPVSISADTVVEAYCVYSGDTSITASATCIYDDGIEEPSIYCDGEYISISCDTGGATIYYKLDHAATYTEYAEAITITADTFVEAYSEIDGRQSEVVSANCIYDDSLKAPVIECDGAEITITCPSSGADIYYRLDQEDPFEGYVSAITITADTFVEAYSVRDTETSTTVSATCIYNPEHDYSQDYLTFRVLSPGVIPWNQVNDGGTGTTARSIQYSLNDGPWISITAASSTKIDVVAGDVVRFKGTNNKYCDGNNKSYNGFDAYNVSNAATYNVEGNAMSLLYGESFADKVTLPEGSTFTLNSLFRRANVVSAENLSLPATACTASCYRGMFAKSPTLVVAPKILPAVVLADSCYKYMFEDCSGIQSAPELPAEVLVSSCYNAMFSGCTNLNYIKCMAVSGLSASQAKANWCQGVAASGTFVKNSNITVTTWGRGVSAIPTGWLVYDDVAIATPVITCDINNNVTITCETPGATIYYKTGQTRAAEYTVYVSAFTIEEDTVVEAYSELNGEVSRTVTQTCEYLSDDPYEYSNRNLSKWQYNNQEVETPYSVNRIDGHSASYAKGTFNFEAGFALKEAEPTYLWFQHADQSASIYIDDTLVEKHWGGYAAFFVDISNYVHSGTNRVKVAVKNNEGNNLAPAAGDFNFNATLGNVKLYTSPYIPAMNYGYDGFHVTSDVATSSATIYIRTSVPTGAVVTCEIDDGTYHYGTSANSTGNEMIFSATVTNPHLWNGLSDPHLYDITMEIYHNGDLYHRYVRPYGLRFYEYVVNQEVNGDTYTGFLLNGQPYLLRGCCMHDDIAGKANALNDADYAQTFSIIQELGCNFLRLAHYPHPKETYDWCDRLGIVVQTEGPCVNKMQSTMPTDYYDHLNTQYDDMVNQHYNHPCIMFWGLSNETTTDDKSFAHDKIEAYITRIKALDSERMVGYVMAQSASDPSGYYNNPSADWFGCNIYEGWYSNQNSNNPSSAINTRVKNIITNKSKAMAYSEYGCGGTQRCHSDDFMTTTTRGNNPRHDIEYMMWLHEGHIAAIKNYPQLLFTSQWQLFDIAVANRNEGYTVCLDGENASTDDSLRRLNDKGLVERDHVTKKDPFYLYKAWWNTTDKFVHICGKDYTKTTDRVIKCYTNDANNGKLSLYVNGTFVEEANATDNIVLFTAYNFSSGDVVRVDGAESSDTFTF